MEALVRNTDVKGTLYMQDLVLKKYLTFVIKLRDILVGSLAREDLREDI